MPIWILIVALLSIAATALLASVLMRVNRPPGARRDRGDGGVVFTLGGGSGGKSKQDGTDHSDSGADAGGGDGGGK